MRCDRKRLTITAKVNPPRLRFQKNLCGPNGCSHNASECVVNKTRTNIASRSITPFVWARRQLLCSARADLLIVVYSMDHSLKSSRMRLICERLTGISVCFLSFILSMKVDLNHGTTSLM